MNPVTAMKRIPILVAVHLFGCAEPFDEDRHDLLGFRIAAVGMHDGLGRAMIWSGEGLYHEQQPELVWRDEEGREIGNGYDVDISEFQQVILDVVDPGGDVYSARYTPSESSQTIEIERYFVKLYITKFF